MRQQQQWPAFGKQLDRLMAVMLMRIFTGHFKAAVVKASFSISIFSLSTSPLFSSRQFTRLFSRLRKPRLVCGLLYAVSICVDFEGAARARTPNNWETPMFASVITTPYFGLP